MKKFVLSVFAFISFAAISSANEIVKDNSKVEIFNSNVKGICNYSVKHTITYSDGSTYSWYTYHSIEADSLEDCKAKLLALQ